MNSLLLKLAPEPPVVADLAFVLELFFGDFLAELEAPPLASLLFSFLA
jgi:hypothetical protein